MNKKADAFLSKVLDMMFNMVGFKKFNKKFTTQEGWYTKKSWTLERRNEFKMFFIEEAKKDLQWSKKLAAREFAMFDLMFGWKIKE